LPPNLSKDEYKKLICDVKSLGVKVAIDTAVFMYDDYKEICPFIIKPNEVELRKMMNSELESEQSLQQAMDKLSVCVDHVLLSKGPSGILYGCRDGLYQVSVPKVCVKTTVGAGDTSLAGFIHSLIRGETGVQSIQFAAASGTASVLLEGTDVVRKSMIKEILEKVDICKIK
jgi:fructose-1-phosphate kinase PfkB-like protein